MSDTEEDGSRPALQSYTAPQDILDAHAEMAEEEEVLDQFQIQAQSKQVAAKQSEYQLRRFDRIKDMSGEGEDESYADRMRVANLEREEEKIRRFKEQMEKDKGGESDKMQIDNAGDRTPPREILALTGADQTPPRGATEDGDQTPPSASQKKSRWDAEDSVKKEDTKGEWSDSALTEAAPKKRRSRWDQTPADEVDATPAPKKSRWDQAPEPTPGSSSGPGSLSGGTNIVMVEDPRYKAITDEELNSLLPGSKDGYKVIPIPHDYVPISKPQRRMMAQPSGGEGFMQQSESEAAKAVAAAGGFTDGEPAEIEGIGSLAFFKAEDAQYFAKVLGENASEAADVGLSFEELKERKIMRLLLKIKNGTPPVRKTALRQITDRAREFGAGPLFDKILPLLMERTLEDQERHLLVKVIDRILYKLDDLVRPYVHKILVVIEPLLIDEDYYARVEGREIISNLSKAAGLAHMISTMRPDIDHVDEYVRNTTARAFSVVASALGIPALLPFLKAVCRSKKSWQARHTGIRIIQQIAVMMGCAVLPHLRNLVDAIANGLNDEQQKVKTMTAQALAALAEAAAPYGIESFDNVLKPLWLGIRQHRGRTLAAFLKAIGFIIPLMDQEYAGYYVKECMPILIREFQTSDEEMRRIVLLVVKQCASTEGVTPTYVREEILPDFFKAFWVRRMALDRRNYKQLVETTVELAQKGGVAEIVGRIVNSLKDESEPFRKMVMETITEVINATGAADIDERMEELLIDGIIYAFQEQTMEDTVMLDGFGAVVNALGESLVVGVSDHC